MSAWVNLNWSKDKDSKKIIKINKQYSKYLGVLFILTQLSELKHLIQN